MVKLLRISEAATLLRISRSKLYQLVEDKRIQHIRIDGRVLFAQKQIERFVREHFVEAAG